MRFSVVLAIALLAVASSFVNAEDATPASTTASAEKKKSDDKKSKETVIPTEQVGVLPKNMHCRTCLLFAYALRKTLKKYPLRGEKGSKQYQNDLRVRLATVQDEARKRALEEFTWIVLDEKKYGVDGRFWLIEHVRKAQILEPDSLKRIERTVASGGDAFVARYIDEHVLAQEEDSIEHLIRHDASLADFRDGLCAKKCSKRDVPENWWPVDPPAEVMNKPSWELKPKVKKVSEAEKEKEEEQTKKKPTTIKKGKKKPAAAAAKKKKQDDDDDDEDL